jgi:hypothetical protein
MSETLGDRAWGRKVLSVNQVSIGFSQNLVSETKKTPFWVRRLLQVMVFGEECHYEKNANTPRESTDRCLRPSPNMDPIDSPRSQNRRSTTTHHTAKQRVRHSWPKKKKSADFGENHKCVPGAVMKRNALDPKEQFLLGKAYTYLRFATILQRIQQNTCVLCVTLARAWVILTN